MTGFCVTLSLLGIGFALLLTRMPVRYEAACGIAVLWSVFWGLLAAAFHKSDQKQQTLDRIEEELRKK